jgi:hypothetical protein
MKKGEFEVTEFKDGFALFVLSQSLPGGKVMLVVKKTRQEINDIIFCICSAAAGVIQQAANNFLG